MSQRRLFEFVILFLILCVTLDTVDGAHGGIFTSLCKLCKKKDTVRVKSTFNQFDIHIHRIISSFLDVHHQGKYSSLNKKMAPIRKYYASMAKIRVKQHLLNGVENIKSKLPSDQISPFDHHFHSLMQYTNEVNSLYSSHITTELIKNTDEANCFYFKPAISEFTTAVGGYHDYHTYNLSTGEIHWNFEAQEGKYSFKVLTFPLAIKYTFNGEQYIQFLNQYRMQTRDTIIDGLQLVFTQKAYVTVSQNLYQAFTFTFLPSGAERSLLLTSLDWVYCRPMNDNYFSCTISNNSLIDSLSDMSDANDTMTIDALIVVQIADNQSTFGIIKHEYNLEGNSF